MSQRSNSPTIAGMFYGTDGSVRRHYLEGGTNLGAEGMYRRLFSTRTGVAAPAVQASPCTWTPVASATGTGAQDEKVG